jgi:biopolymer transport protein ExbB
MLLDWFDRGGFMMWPILLCSVIGFAVIADRLYAHGRAWILYEKFLEELKGVFGADRKPGQIPAWLIAKRAPEARVAAVYLQYAAAEPEIRNEALRREGERFLADWNRHLKIIYTISQVTPLMGLLGTVFGLVRAFYNIEALGGRVRPDDLAGGIWEALLTTVAGLSVAIPAFLAYQYFLASGERKARRMKEVISLLDETMLAEVPPAPERAEAAAQDGR